MSSDAPTPDAPTEDIVRQGDVIDGKYVVEGLIGEGGMAIVVAARHLQLERRVALKILKPAAIASGEVVIRFLREARAAARLSTEHVARVLDVGTLATGLPYLVMEYLRGADLGMVLRQRGPLPVADAVDLLLQACEAIAEAHAYGIVHRDIKPDNLFLTRRPDGAPVVKVLDFGVAKAGASSGEDKPPDVTQPSVTFGSPAYMSPEQVRSARDVDVRTDIWSMGVMLYELVSGQQPFCASTAPETCAMVLRDTPRPLANLVEDLPPGFAAVVHCCLEKNPDRRFSTIADFAEAASPFGGPGASLYARRVRVVLDSSSPTMPPPEPSDPMLSISAEHPAANLDLLRRASSETQTSATTRLPPRPRGGIPLRYSILGALVLTIGAALITLVLLQGYRHPDSVASAEPAASSAPTAASPPASSSADLLPIPAPSSSVAAEPPLTPPSASSPATSAKPPARSVPSPQPRKKNDLYGNRR